ncbi:MAG: response regulator [Planctomycetota bacterium]|jgi:DNA-binding response OmpR family regulator
MKQAKILIIDDDPDITEVMKLVLENKGYNVESAVDSASGMESVKNSRPDLIILDVMMNSSREGFIFSRELRNNEECKNIPILMVTAVKEKTGIDFKEVAGDDTWLPVDEFLDKPIKPDVLVTKVRELLGNS